MVLSMSSLRISPDRTAVCVIAASALVFGVVAYAARWRWARVTPAPPTTTPAAPPAAKQGEVVKDQAPPGGSSTGVAAGRHLVVNYFYQRKCNYGCYFCFHTEKSLPVSEAEQAMDMEELSRGKQFSREDKERGLRNLKAHGMERVTFSGGEPFFNAAELGGLVDFCKEVLGVKVAIVSNGSLIKKRWMEKHAKNLDVLTISCDSFDGSTLMEIGRVEKYKADPAAAAAAHIKKENNLFFAKVFEIRDWCEDYGVSFKINSVVTQQALGEDFSRYISRLRPRRWKLFQPLAIDGENQGRDFRGGEARRNISDHLVSAEDFHRFCDTQLAALGECATEGSVRGLVSSSRMIEFVREANSTMRNSYLLLDENMRFLDCRSGYKIPSSTSVLRDCGRALAESGFILEDFEQRKGNWANAEGEDAALSLVGKTLLEES